jgi:hypothetical protein
MTGDGQVLKRRLVEGSGEFPMDCPLNDTTVRLHFRARPVREPPAEWVHDSRGGDAAAQPLEFDTGRCWDRGGPVWMGTGRLAPAWHRLGCTARA